MDANGLGPLTEIFDDPIHELLYPIFSSLEIPRKCRLQVLPRCT
jgi:hypothetical protein